MQIYLQGYDLYSFNRQKVSEVKYMSKNSPASQKHQKHDESNVKHKKNILVKYYWNVRLLIVSYS